jgi:hypothetical protein
MANTVDLLEDAKAKRLLAEHIRENARGLKRLSDRLLALESAAELDRQAEVLNAWGPRSSRNPSAPPLKFVGE